MLNLKGCPKCQGALYLASDMYGKYVNCLQCGFTRDLPDHREAAIQAQPTASAPQYRAPARKAA